MVKTIDKTELVIQAQSECQYALNRLATDVCNRIYPALLKMTRDEDLANDLLQETVLVMLIHLKDLEQVERFWGWIFTIARNRAYDHFRKKRHLEIVGSIDFDNVSEDKNNTVLKTVINKEMKEELAAAIGNLRYRYREVVLLRHFEQKSYAEIASMSDCTPQQARIRYFRAKQSLRERFCAVGYDMDW